MKQNTKAKINLFLPNKKIYKAFHTYNGMECLFILYKKEEGREIFDNLRTK